MTHVTYDLEGECAIPGPTVQYACLNPDDNKFQVGEICEVSGWGDTEGQSGHVFNFAKQLQSGFVKIQSFNDCAAKYGGGIEEKIHLCAYDDKVDAMAGDDGGPLTCFDVSSFCLQLQRDSFLKLFSEK